jgi:hypothetical protein
MAFPRELLKECSYPEVTMGPDYQLDVLQGRDSIRARLGMTGIILGAKRERRELKPTPR